MQDWLLVLAWHYHGWTYMFLKISIVNQNFQLFSRDEIFWLKKPSLDKCSWACSVFMFNTCRYVLVTINWASIILFFNEMFNSFKIRPVLRARKASDQFHVSLSISNKTYSIPWWTIFNQLITYSYFRSPISWKFSISLFQRAKSFLS